MGAMDRRWSTIYEIISAGEGHEQFGQFLGNLVRMLEMLPEMKRRIEGPKILI